VLAQLLLGLALGAAIGWLGYRLGTFSASGIVGVAVVSGFTFGAAGWVWGILPHVLFIGWIVWSRYGATRKAQLPGRSAAGSRRDLRQVLAGAGWATILALLHRAAPHAIGVFAAYIGALATSSADSWATELGVLSVQLPRLVTSGRRVPAGTPGAISVLGSVASLGGAWLIGLLGLVFAVLLAWLKNVPWDRILLWLPLAGAAGGMVGSLADSLLGGTAQGLYFCERCKVETETRIHSCGQVAQQVRGWRWLTNDGIDLISSVVGAAVAAGITVWLAQSSISW
jgi:uncharacterized protein (TIGR00297 family)